MSDITIERRERVTLVRFDRGDGVNGLSHALIKELTDVARSFERVFVVNALHHFDDGAAFVTEAYRVLRPGGELMIFGLGLGPGQRREDWYVYEYFERTLELDRARYPAPATICAWMGAAGFDDCASRVGHRIDQTAMAQAYLNSGALTRESTSQLTLLSPEEFEAGLQRLRDAISAAKNRGESLQLRADLKIYATSGRRR
ncbi:MAG: class I SAM-dependent methyltransferase [Myxococcales bacterium]|nr:class I SAM-dependent methyltransferase [Myxococcales bacterium]